MRCQPICAHDAEKKNNEQFGCNLGYHYKQVVIFRYMGPGRVEQSVGHLTRKSGVLGSIPGLAIYFCFSFCFFKKGSCQLLAKVCARSTG